MLTNVREKLNENKMGASVGVGLLTLAILLIAYHYFTTVREHVDVTRAYYSEDDGQSYYTDSIYNFPPFDHSGKTAVQAVVAVSNGHYFVGYLMRFTPEIRKRLQDKYDDCVKSGVPLQQPVLNLLNSLSGTMEVKLPGDHPWVPISRVGTLNVTGPDGQPPDRYILQP
jgi:hypothetical protein